MALSVEEAAERLGMHPAEITDVVEKRGEGTVVTLHDGHRQLIRDEVVYWYGYTPGAEPTKGGPPNAGLPLWTGATDEEPKAKK